MNNKQPSPQSSKSFEEVSRQIYEHMLARDWHANPSRGIAISIAIEASELLEHYQWNETAIGDQAAIAEELADILIYAIQFGQVNDIDIVGAIEKKLEKSNKKFPAELFKHKTGIEQEQNRLKAKLNYKKPGL